jgi:hypothetical protein
MGLADNAARAAAAKSTTSKVTQTAQFTKAQIEAKERAAAKPVTAKQLIAAGETKSEAYRFANLAAQAAAKKTAASTKPTTTSIKPITTNVNKPATTNSTPTTTGNSGNQSNTGNGTNNAGESSSDSSQSATPPSFESSSGSSSTSTVESSPPPVKSAPIDAVIFQDESFAEEFLIDVLFEDVVGQELLTIARGETVNGQEVIYQPIKNLGLLQNIYNPNNILGLTDTSASFFASFSINLNEKIPNKADPITGKNYYVDESNGDIVIELVNIQDDEQVDIQLATSGTIDRLGI